MQTTPRNDRKKPETVEYRRPFPSLSKGRSLGHWRRATNRSYTTTMKTASESAMIPDEQLCIEQRGDGSIVVRVRSDGPDGGRLPDAVFSFRCGDPQYSYWLERLRSATSGNSAGGLAR
jgi:hypothetical protein